MLLTPLLLASSCPYLQDQQNDECGGKGGEVLPSVIDKGVEAPCVAMEEGRYLTTETAQRDVLVGIASAV